MSYFLNVTMNCIFYVCVGSTQAACHIYVCKIMAGKHFSKGQPQKIRLQPLLNEYFHLAKCDLSRKFKNVFFLKGSFWICQHIKACLNFQMTSKYMQTLTDLLSPAL